MSDLIAQAFVGTLAAGGAVLWYLYGRPRPHTKPENSSHYGSHGTARWARPEELRRHLRPTGPGFVFGRLQPHRNWMLATKPGGYLILSPDPRIAYNQNVTVLGTTGSQKTRSVIQPNIMQVALSGKESIIVIDPKGENYARSAKLLRSKGFRVSVFNLEHKVASGGWNCLDCIEDVADAQDLAVNLVANTVNPNRPRTGDPFWDNAEQAFIAALVLYIKRHRPSQEQHMASVLELGTDLSPEALDAVFLSVPRNDPARRYYRTFLRAEEKIRSGVVAGLGSRLQLWNDPELARLTSYSTFTLDELGTAPHALFLIIPDSKPTYAPLLALFWQQVFQRLYHVADQHGGRLPFPVRCLMDEIANCGYIPDYEMRKSTMRSRGVSTVEIWQNLTQMQHRYKAWEELLGNSDHLLFLGGNDMKTAEHISKALGQTTIRLQNTSSTESDRSGSTSRSEQYTGRPLMTPDEVLRLPSNEAILIPRGTYPARIRKASWEEHPLYSDCQLEDHKSHVPPAIPELFITDVAALWAATQRRAPQPPDTGTTEGGVGTADPLDFLDTDHTDHSDDQTEE